MYLAIMIKLAKTGSYLQGFLIVQFVEGYVFH